MDRAGKQQGWTKEGQMVAESQRDGRERQTLMLDVEAGGKVAIKLDICIYKESFGDSPSVYGPSTTPAFCKARIMASLRLMLCLSSAISSCNSSSSSSFA